MMDLDCIPDDCWIEHGPAMFRSIVGDETDWLMLQDHWKGMTIDAIAEKYGEPRSTAHRWITQAKMRLRRAGFPIDEIPKIGKKGTYTPYGVGSS